MSYIKQVMTVTRWEYKRFFKLKNELLGIVVMLVIFAISYFGGNLVKKSNNKKTELHVSATLDQALTEQLKRVYDVVVVDANDVEGFLAKIRENKKGLMLQENNGAFQVDAWKKPGGMKKMTAILDAYVQQRSMNDMNISEEQFAALMQKATVNEQYVEDTRSRKVLIHFFAGLMIMAIFLSFSYQFTAITGEKQLRITEQIVSAIKPQVWMDGKILGITLTGLSSVLTYSILSILGGLIFFQLTKTPLTNIFEILHLPSILIFLVFTLVGILLWNAIMAGIASLITDPNNSGKSSLMLLPLLFVIASLVVGPASSLAPFMSWFPLTSATSMPMRWVVSTVQWWEIPGSLLVLAGTLYFSRKLAANIFRVSILMSGKEPSWREVFRLVRK